jgi:hypothetical protein
MTMQRFGSPVLSAAWLHCVVWNFNAQFSAKQFPQHKQINGRKATGHLRPALRPALRGRMELRTLTFICRFT